MVYRGGLGSPKYFFLVSFCLQQLLWYVFVTFVVNKTVNKVTCNLVSVFKFPSSKVHFGSGMPQTMFRMNNTAVTNTPK